MAFKNEIYTCGNAECKPYLFNSKVLLDVIVDGKPFSINSDLPYFQYESDDEILETRRLDDIQYLVVVREATCPHCKGEASLHKVLVDMETDRAHIHAQLDGLEDQIAKLMEQFKGQ